MISFIVAVHFTLARTRSGLRKGALPQGRDSFTLGERSQ